MSDFKSGDVVIWQEGDTYYRRDEWGKVLRVTPKGTVFVKAGDKEKEFCHSRGLRKPTAHEIAKRMWLRRRPGQAASGSPLELASIYFGLARRGNDSPQSIDLGKIDSPDKARKAAAELLAIATWWDEEPKP